MSEATIIRGDALRLPFRDESVDLVVTSPPYHGLRSYRDSGEHYAGQIGSEATPQEFLEALWSVMSEVWRCLKPTGSAFINLGDRRSGSGGHNNSGITKPDAANWSKSSLKLGKHKTVRGAIRAPLPATRRNAPDRYTQAAFGRAKSKMLLPHRFAIGCEDGLADPDGIGWIVRQDIVWSKVNGLPESVTDRTRDSHEFWFHLVKQGRYFAGVDEVREAHAEGTAERYAAGYGDRSKMDGQRHGGNSGYDLGGDWKAPALGKVPGSVWPIPSEPLIIPPAIQAHYDLPDHFAAFPTEWPRRLILGWSPSAVCLRCGEGRRPVVEKGANGKVRPDNGGAGLHSRSPSGRPDQDRGGRWAEGVTATITGYTCAEGCDPEGPSKPAVVLDVFGGTGTTAGVARALGRTAVSVDLSSDYCRLARWRVQHSGHFAKVMQRTHRDNQGDLFSGSNYRGRAAAENAELETS